MPFGGLPTTAPRTPAGLAPQPTAAGVAVARAADARLARVHLRVGLMPLARAALEQMAGAGTLDREALADLAEVRWRSGDLEGAAEAARAHLASGGVEPMAHLVLAEDLHRRGHEHDAHQHAAAVITQVGGAVDMLFAGEPRGDLWPPADESWMDRRSDWPGCCGLLVGGGEVSAPDPHTWTPVPLALPQAVPGMGQPPRAPLEQMASAAPGGPTSPGRPSPIAAAVMSGRAAGDELKAAERAVAEGRIPAAAERLALLLRQDHALAPVILTVASQAAATAALGSPGLAAIHVLRGDAFRILGRETEADAAFAQARQALSAGPPPKETS
jgi:hypothetical protein